MSWDPLLARRALAATAALVLGAAAAAPAHHSFAAEFDGTRLLTLRGTIVKLEWTNPHVHLWIDVKSASGEAEQWGFELPPPNALSRRAVRPTMLRPGDEVAVTAFPARDGRTFGSAQTIALKNGKTIAARSPNARK